MANKTRILAFDTSLSRTGVAVLEVKNGKARVESVGHVKTSDKDTHALRTKHIEHWVSLFVRENYGGPKTGGYDYIVREAYQGKFGHQTIFAAWNAVDRALEEFNLEVTEKPIHATTVKKQVTGRGSADKDEVEEAVRKFTGYDGEFACDDESDAVAIGLSYAIQADLIESLKQ